jgi:CRP/FNR family transcriptional regulator, cyclic AMP receptor protein
VIAHTGVLVAAGTVTAWVVPLILFVLVVVTAWLGLRWIRSEHLEALRATPLFSLLSDRELRLVLRSTRAVTFPPGATVIKQGQRGQGFFVITDGTAKVTQDGTELATLGAGSYFGEISVIDGGPRIASITAQSPVSTLEISPGAFNRLVDREPMIAQSIYLELSQRMKDGGIPVDEGTGDRIDRERLIELCRSLRETQQADWAQVASSRPRRLWLTQLFARGS